MPGSPSPADQAYLATLRDYERRISALEAATRLASVQLVTSLPTNGAADGQLIDYLADAANGVAWRFRYRSGSGSAHKWEFVGGGPVISGPQGSITTASTTLVALTGGPSVTLPFAGDYEIGFSAACQQNAAAGANNEIAALIKNGVLTQIGTQALNFIALGQFAGVTQVVSQRINGFAAGDVVSVAVENANGVSTIFANGALTVRPIRVG